MARKRVTMQDIADACGLTRNTVSKIFNGRGSVPEATRQLVLEKARELGYHHQPEDTPETVKGVSIALLTQYKLLSHSFGSYFITSFTDQISRSGYTMKIYEVSPGELAAKRLPPHFVPEETAGILGIELFDRNYIEMICSLRKPTLFVDSFAQAGKNLLGCDFISMENIAGEAALTRRMIAAGARRLGFVGDIAHCNSFYERWVGFRAALGEAGLTVDPACCILEKDSDAYGDTAWLLRHLNAMLVLPDAFACANDYLAIHLMTALKKKGLKIPAEVMVAGFDGSVEASVVEPALATAQIPSAEIGRLAAALLSERIRFPEGLRRRIYVDTVPIWGGSIR